MPSASSDPSFGMTSDEFLEILRVCLKDYLEYSEKKLDNIAKAVFIIFDDDQNDLVDALEFLAAFAVISGMTPEEKTRYVFGIFDFDESGLLSVDEMILALRTTIRSVPRAFGEGVGVGARRPRRNRHHYLGQGHRRDH